jgi:hypothetical protein
MYPILSAVAQLNDSKLMWGAAAVFLNLGSRFVVTDMTALQAKFFSRRLAKVMVVFCMLFLTTRDVFVSIAMSAIVVLVMFGLVNEQSPYCILPGTLQQARVEISREMYERAKELVSRYEEQNHQ